MSDEAVDGVLFVVGDRVCFIPREDLRSYRLPDDAAVAARRQLEAQMPEVSGFGAQFDAGMVFGVQYTIGKPGDTPTLGFSSLIGHAITVIKPTTDR